MCQAQGPNEGSTGEGTALFWWLREGRNEKKWAWLGFHILSFRRNSSANFLGWGNFISVCQTALHKFDYQHIALITWKSNTLDQCPEAILTPIPPASTCSLLFYCKTWPVYLASINGNFLPSKIPVNALCEQHSLSTDLGRSGYCVCALLSWSLPAGDSCLCKKLRPRRGLAAAHEDSIPFQA